ncbi:haloalkane dehalogenase [Alphaproteobacteria bacterium GH1-50]|uniref:Haloalkane dehalogenase n=1 Tax=Kangsaoukella pontilimi TaxID=2691042 RepID=A0A7C9IQE1_9RHOB|nr:haloalkane dehalogenase [Kangsaoukella pontilimi]MXQ09030.1 haloalkane dehalogenase [Kangsaoukella pontilimi]
MKRLIIHALFGAALTAPLSPAAAEPRSNFIEVEGARLHYLEIGEGKPILLLHGNPTSSYLWRNVIPLLEDSGRVIAPDLVGFGRSDKPQIDYAFQNHYRYVEGFIEALALEDVTLVLHDWGSVLGLNYARQNEENVHAVAFLEAIIPPAFPVETIEALGPAADIFRAFRDPETGPQLLIEQNVFIEQILPAQVIRQLTDTEMEAYRAPFADPAAREPIRMWPNELPIAGEPARNVAVVQEVGDWLRLSETPKLLIYFDPGAIVPPEAARWMQDNYNNIEIRYGGEARHFAQEDQPKAIGRHIADWLRVLDR